MKNQIIKYIVLFALGALIGVAMQYTPQIQGEWGQNIIYYMAIDLGCWATIAILIATYSKSPLDSGIGNFVFMMAMVIFYYIIMPQTIYANIRWVVMGILMFPIGVFTYYYKKNKIVFGILEVAQILFVLYNVFVLVEMFTKGQTVVSNSEGIYVYIEHTWVTIGNYLLLMAFNIFGGVFMFVKHRDYQKKKIK